MEDLEDEIGTIISTIDKPCSTISNKSIRNSTRKNTPCKIPDCPRLCKVTQFLCPSCWNKVPRYLQEKLFNSYVIPMEILGVPNNYHSDNLVEFEVWVTFRYGLDKE